MPLLIHVEPGLTPTNGGTNVAPCATRGRGPRLAQ